MENEMTTSSSHDLRDPDQPAATQRSSARKSPRVWISVLLGCCAFLVGGVSGLVAAGVVSGSTDEIKGLQTQLAAAESELETVEKELAEAKGKLSELSHLPDEGLSQSQPVPQPDSKPESQTLPLGSTVSDFGVDFKLNSVDLVDSLPAKDGTQVTAAQGRQLVVFNATVTNTGTDAIDLTCSGIYSAFIQVYDDKGNELAENYDDHLIEGNPECNYFMVNGETADWTFAFEIANGASPSLLTLTDTDTFSRVHTFRLQ